jgi:rhamnosyltransferase
MATFNGQRWVGEQLAGILRQRDVQVEVCVSDDGSSDQTLAVLQQCIDAGAAIQLLPPAGQRLGAAGNFLRLLREVDLGVFDAVALSDQDDLWPDRRLADALERMHADGAQAYSSDVIAFWPGGRRRRLGKAHAQRRFDHLFEPAGPGCTYVLSRAFAQQLQSELRLHPERFGGLGYHDWLIYAYARTHGLRWLIDREASVLYRQHDANELGANAALSGLPVRWRRLTSSWFREQVLRIGCLWNGPHAELIARLERWRLADRLWVALHARELRRRPRDQLALAAMCLLGVLR